MASQIQQIQTLQTNLSVVYLLHFKVMVRNQEFRQ